MEKAEKLMAIARYYYARRDIQKALVLQAQHREVVPSYGLGCFGKRPDVIEYENDIFNLAMNGATSFHCSEEQWSNPLELNTAMREEQLNKLRIGWNLLLDVDCKFLEYSKRAAELLCRALYFHDIRNFGLKFSGRSGFHIGLAFDAFPKEINSMKIKDFFPQGPRTIACYLKEMIKEDLKLKILEISTLKEIVEASGKPKDYFMKKRCKSCGEEPVKKRIIEYAGKEKTEKEDLVCPKCGTGYLENMERFHVGEEFSPFSVLEIDTVLIAPRHLYRMAYSLNEKSGLASIVIKPEQLKAFHLGWASPERVFPKPFLPTPEQNEALELFRNALDWNAKKQEKKTLGEIKEEIKTKVAMKPIAIEKIGEEILPPCIKAILKGVKQDGRKRALFILINFFKSLGFDSDEIEKRIKEWNSLNYKPLKENYVATQLNWFKRQDIKMPPNCGLTVYYQDIGVCVPDFVCGKIKNPINYVALKAKMADTGGKGRRKAKVF